MCDVIGQALRHGVPRRGILKAALAGTAALGATAYAGGTAMADTPTTSPAATPAGGPPAEGARTQLVLLGTSGGPPEWPGSTRAGISSAVLVGDRYYIVDAGAGVVRQARNDRLG